jgi:hypothetical protein
MFTLIIFSLAIISGSELLLFFEGDIEAQVK